jgi:hypothetical protein
MHRGVADAGPADALTKLPEVNLVAWGLRRDADWKRSAGRTRLFVATAFRGSLWGARPQAAGALSDHASSAGLLLGFVPGIPRVTLNPDIVFFVILPPLLNSAAWVTSWREFRFNLVSILLLAFGLVAFTVRGVAEGAPWLFAGFDWKAGLVLGAVVAPTDAIAASSLAKRIGLPKRITDVLEGESLVNDASGLLALEFGLLYGPP